MRHPDDQSPVNPLPPLVWALFLALAIPEAVFSLGEAGLVGGPGAVGWRLNALNTYAFSGDAFDFMLGTLRPLPEHLLRFVTYPFVHGSFTAFLFAAVILLAMGKMVGEVLGGGAVVLVFAVSTVLGATIFGLLTNQSWLTGAFTGVYGLIGTFTFLLWSRLAATGGPQMRAFTLIGLLMGIQLIFGLLFTVGYAWVAELSGFCVGFLVTALLVPGGVDRLLDRLRQR